MQSRETELHGIRIFISTLDIKHSCSPLAGEGNQSLPNARLLYDIRRLVSQRDHGVRLAVARRR